MAVFKLRISPIEDEIFNKLACSMQLWPQPNNSSSGPTMLGQICAKLSFFPLLQQG